MARLRFVSLVLALSLSACCARSATHATMIPARTASLADERHAAAPASRGTAGGEQPITVGRTRLPSGRAIAELPLRECRRILRNAGVQFDVLPSTAAPAIASPLAIRSPMLGIEFDPSNGMAKNGVVDCRLAAALLAWAPILRDAGIERVEHYSTYRPGARVRSTGKTSGHAHALAIDAARFFLANGRILEVDVDWDERERGGAPCPVRRSENEDGRILRQVVCRAVERGLFQVVITPHHDRDHQNHVHLELVPDVSWSYVH
jgi:hypothetical protein